MGVGRAGLGVGLLEGRGWSHSVRQQWPGWVQPVSVQGTTAHMHTSAGHAGAAATWAPMWRTVSAEVCWPSASRTCAEVVQAMG